MRLWADRSRDLLVGTSGRFFLPERLRPTFYLTRSELFQHGHIIGTSGSGKSMFQAHVAFSLLRLGLPVVLIDPHGDLARLLLAMLVEAGAFHRPEAFERILYLDFPAAEAARRYLPMNILARGGDVDDIASDVKDAFHRAFSDLGETAPTFDTLLPDAVELLVKNGLPLTSLFSLFTNDTLREQLLGKEDDEFLVESWALYTGLRSRSEQMKYAGSVMRRARQLTRTKILRYGLCQNAIALDFGRIITNQQCVIINLALQNQDAKNLLGSLLTVSIEHAAKSRGAIPLEYRRGSMHVLIDEFQLFCGRDVASFTGMLSEARKYNVFLWAAHQDWSQIPPRLRGALGNAGVEITFGLSRKDSEESAKEVGTVDLSQTKQSEDADEQSLTAFKSVPDQWEEWITTIKDLPVSEAIIAVRKRTRRHWYAEWLTSLGLRRERPRVSHIQTMAVRKPVVDGTLLAGIQQYYLSRYFVPEAEAKAQLAHTRAAGRAAEPPLLEVMDDD